MAPIRPTSYSVSRIQQAGRSLHFLMTATFCGKGERNEHKMSHADPSQRRCIEGLCGKQIAELIFNTNRSGA